MRQFVSRNENTWIELHDQSVKITQIDKYDCETEHLIILTTKHQLRTLIGLLTAALQEYED